MNGAREVHEKVLDKIEDKNLAPIFIWLPCYPGDSRNAALKAKQLVTDTRATFFWDGKGILGERYGQVIDLPDNREFAWDVYLLFGKKAEWNDELPRPSYWMHQLGQDQRRLDATKLRQQIEGLLEHRSNSK